MNAFTLVTVAALLTPALCRAQDVVWDYGPQTGPVGGCWQNVAEAQNFADLVVLEAGTRINGYELFTCIDGIDGMTFEFKLFADDAGVPGAELARFTLANRAFSVEADQFRYDFSFDDIFLDPGSYWVGLAGVGFEAGQTSINPGPGDSQMAQFSGPSFGFFTGVGDQMFRLLGVGAPGCYPDFDGNGTLDLFDFLAFVNNFNGGGPESDCDNNGVHDLFDFLCFVNAFNAGC